MEADSAMIDHLFPNFEKFINSDVRFKSLKGSLAVKVPRILGQGTTRAEGVEMPPSPIERRLELVSLQFPDGVEPPSEVVAEIETARILVKRELDILCQPEGIRRFATQCLKSLTVATGVKDSHFYAGKMILAHQENGKSWSWCLTPHYPIVSKLPPDISYVVQAHAIAEKIIENCVVSPEAFRRRLELAWAIARHFSNSDDVLIADVARMYQVASQEDRFWSAPARRHFFDVPQAAFIANMINWRRVAPPIEAESTFEFVPATLTQAHGPKSKAYFLPVNAEGTQVRPVIYMRRKGK